MYSVVDKFIIQNHTTINQVSYLYFQHKPFSRFLLEQELKKICDNKP